jgi:hypothetical protein
MAPISRVRWREASERGALPPLPPELRACAVPARPAADALSAPDARAPS